MRASVRMRVNYLVVSVLLMQFSDRKLILELNGIIHGNNVIAIFMTNLHLR